MERLNEDLNIIAGLEDSPNDAGMSAAELKGKFDQAGNIIKDYLNTEVFNAIEGKVNEPASEGAAGQVLVTNGAGGRRWATVEGQGDMLMSVYDPDKDGVIAVSAGGTGCDNLRDAENAMLNALQEGTTTPTDSDFYISQTVGGGETYYRRPMTALWRWISAKITSVFGISASDYSGNAATATKATQDGSGNVITTTYAKASHKHAPADISAASAPGTLAVKRIKGGTAEMNETILSSMADGDIYIQYEE